MIIIMYFLFFEWKSTKTYKVYIIVLLYWSTIEIDIILYYMYAAIDEEETELYTTKKEIYIYIYIQIYTVLNI